MMEQRVGPLLGSEMLTRSFFLRLCVQKGLLDPKKGGEEQMKYKSEDLRTVILREPDEPVVTVPGVAAAPKEYVSFEQDPAIMDLLVWVGLHFVRCVVGDQTYQANVRDRVPFWDWATDSDLAFALMVLDQYYEEAKKELDKKRNRSEGDDSDENRAGRSRQVGRPRTDGEVNKKGTTLRGAYLEYRDALHESMQDSNKTAAAFKEKYNKAFEEPAYAELFGVGQEKTTTDDVATVKMSEAEKLSSYLSLGSL